MDILFLSIYIGWRGNVIGQTCPIWFVPLLKLAIH